MFLINIFSLFIVIGGGIIPPLFINKLKTNQKKKAYRDDKPFSN